MDPTALQAVAQFVTEEVLSGRYSLVPPPEGLKIGWSSRWTGPVEFVRLMQNLSSHLVSFHLLYTRTESFPDPKLNRWLPKLNRLQSLTLETDETTVLGDALTAWMLGSLPSLRTFCLDPGIEQPIGPQTAMALQLWCTQLVELSLNNTRISSQDLSSVAQRITSLKSLTIGWRPYRVSKTKLTLVGAHLRTLHLTFAVIDLHELANGAPNLESLTLVQTVLENLRCNSPFTFVGLKSLTLDDVWYPGDRRKDRICIADAEFRAFLPTCARLDCLGLIRCTGLTDTSFLALSGRLTSLTQLTIRDCGEMTGGGCAQLIPIQPRLRELTLSTATLIPNLRRAIQGLTALRKLKMGGLSLSANDFPLLHTRFHVVDLEGCTLEQGTMEALLRQFRQGPQDNLTVSGQILHRPSTVLVSNPWQEGLLTLHSHLEPKEPPKKKVKTPPSTHVEQDGGDV